MMEYAPELLEILACPKCRGKVVLDQTEVGFVCETCALVYKIEDGIANFLLEEAKPLVRAEKNAGAV